MRPGRIPEQSCRPLPHRRGSALAGAGYIFETPGCHQASQPCVTTWPHKGRDSGPAPYLKKSLWMHAVWFGSCTGILFTGFRGSFFSFSKTHGNWWSLERLLGDHLAMSGLFRTHFVTRKSPAKRPYISRGSLWRLWKDHKIWRMPYFFCSFRLRRPGGQTGGDDLRQITAMHMEEAGRGCLPKNPLCLSGGKGEERKNV